MALKMTAPQICLFIFNFKHDTSIKITFLENFLFVKCRKIHWFCVPTLLNRRIVQKKHIEGNLLW